MIRRREYSSGARPRDHVHLPSDTYVQYPSTKVPRQSKLYDMALASPSSTQCSPTSTQCSEDKTFDSMWEDTSSGMSFGPGSARKIESGGRPKESKMSREHARASQYASDTYTSAEFPNGTKRVYYEGASGPYLRLGTQPQQTHSPRLRAPLDTDKNGCHPLTRSTPSNERHSRRLEPRLRLQATESRPAASIHRHQSKMSSTQRRSRHAPIDETSDHKYYQNLHDRGQKVLERMHSLVVPVIDHMPKEETDRMRQKQKEREPEIDPKLNPEAPTFISTSGNYVPPRNTSGNYVPARVVNDDEGETDGFLTFTDPLYVREDKKVCKQIESPRGSGARDFFRHRKNQYYALFTCLEQDTIW